MKQKLSMGASYELIYFNFRGRAELARLILALADVDYTDTRMTSPENWLQFKQELPFGQLPILKIDNCEMLCQSHAISRYLAKEFGFAGKTNLENSKCDAIVDCVIDLMAPIESCYREPSEAKKEEMRTKYEEQLPDFLEKFETLLKTNDDGDGYFVGDSITWADLAVMNAWHWIPGFQVFPKLHEYPKLDAHRQRIESHPRIKTWLDTRPVTPV